MNLWELQSQWDSEYDRKQFRYARMAVKKQKDNIATDIVISLLVSLIIVFLYITLPGFEMVSPGEMP